MAANVSSSAADPRAPPRRTNFVFTAPSTPVAFGLLVAGSFVAAVVTVYPTASASSLGAAWAYLYLGPALVAALLTTPIAKGLGGRFEFRRSVLLAGSGLALILPILLVGRLALALAPTYLGSIAPVVWFLAGPLMWLRHLSLYGVSRASHARSMAPALLQPVAGLVGAFAWFPSTFADVAAAAIFLGLGFLCAALLLRATDRPMRREFKVSGVSLIRPMLDHVSRRDPGATETLEAFFERFSVPADLRVRLVGFRSGADCRATVALPTVHPGPFAALGASDLPRKLREHLAPRGGFVFVPHTPCDHDLDLPSDAQLRRVVDALDDVQRRLDRPGGTRGSSRLVSPRPGSLARAQWLDGVAWVIVSQAPHPTDDISYAVADRIRRELLTAGVEHVALIDAHNSYVPDEGDISYATSTAETLVRDAKAAVLAARDAAVPGPLEIGTAARTGYGIREHGIGPEGIRALVVRTAGTTTAYVLIDGNNLMIGARERILRSLLKVVDDAEVLTTDNHVVHEVDGGVNPVAERYPADAIARDAREVVEQAVGSLAPVEVVTAEAEVPNVRVLAPGFAGRLMTSLGDTQVVFGHAAVTTLLVLVALSTAVILVIR